MARIATKVAHVPAGWGNSTSGRIGVRGAAGFPTVNGFCPLWEKGQYRSFGVG